MKTLRSLRWLVFVVILPYFLMGCAATSFDVGAHGDVDLPGFKGGFKVDVNHQGQKVFVLVNPTDTPACVQPKDANGNNIGGPLELPAGGQVELPPNADSGKSQVVPKPKTQTKPVEVKPKSQLSARNRGVDESSSLALSSTAQLAPQPLAIRWVGVVTSFDASGKASITEYSIAAANPSGVFSTLDLLDQGVNVSNAELVADTDLAPINSTTGSFSIRMPSSKIASFEVYVNGLLVASSATGLGGAVVVHGADGLGAGSAQFAFDFTAKNAEVVVITTDSLGATQQRKVSYDL